MKRTVVAVLLVAASLFLLVWCVLPDPKTKQTQVTIDTIQWALQTQSEQ